LPVTRAASQEYDNEEDNTEVKVDGLALVETVRNARQNTCNILLSKVSNNRKQQLSHEVTTNQKDHEEVDELPQKLDNFGGLLWRSQHVLAVFL
jgi:hypothetical protein